MKLVIDMNLSTDWVPVLRAAGFDAVHWAEIGTQAASDAEIMSWAIANGWIILTRDLDFSTALIMDGKTAPSVIQIRIAQVSPERHLPLVQRALSRYRTQLEQGAVVTLKTEQIRVRVLAPETNA